MIEFRDEGTRDIYQGDFQSKAARRTCPQELMERARRKMIAMNAASSLSELGKIPGNRLEKLEGARTGQYSIRINDQYRICFVWKVEDPTDVEIVDYHR